MIFVLVTSLKSNSLYDFYFVSIGTRSIIRGLMELLTTLLGTLAKEVDRFKPHFTRPDGNRILRVDLPRPLVVGQGFLRLAGQEPVIAIAGKQHGKILVMR